METEHIRVGDYYIPNLTLPEEARPISKWGRMRREYLKEHNPIQYNAYSHFGEGFFPRHHLILFLNRMVSFY